MDSPKEKIAYQFYDWEGSACRTTGDFFKGTAERYIIGEGWKQSHFFDITEKARPISALEAQTIIENQERKAKNKKPATRD